MNRPALSTLRPVLRVLLNTVARPILRARLGEAASRRILDRTWELYPSRLATVDRTSRLGLGPSMVMRLSACTVALHDTLMECGITHDAAVEIASELAWAVYRKMGGIPWLLSGFITRDPVRRLNISTQIFRRFPFGPSAYTWVSKPAPYGIVAFDCLRCPVAEHFSKAGLSDLCVRTFCDLDFPLAADWSATLVRSGSIAAGAPLCDFRWQTNADRKRVPIKADATPVAT